MELAIQKCFQPFRKLSYGIFASSNSNPICIFCRTFCLRKSGAQTFQNITQTPVINIALTASKATTSQC